jgi:hypothetical protein
VRGRATEVTVLEEGEHDTWDRGNNDGAKTVTAAEATAVALIPC